MTTRSSDTRGGMLAGSSSAPGGTSPTAQESPVCYPVRCPKCQKVTWDGCGEHAAEVMAGVAPDQRCTCPR